MLFTDLPPAPPSERRQTLLGCEQNAFPVCRNKQRRNRRKEILQLIKQAVSEILEEGDEVRFGSFNVELCLLDLNLSIKPVQRFFVYKCKLSLALLYLVDLFINKLKTKFNNLFYRMILNTKRIHNSFWRNFPARAKQTPSKVLFVAMKKRRPRPFGHCAPKLWSL